MKNTDTVNDCIDPQLKFEIKPSVKAPLSIHVLTPDQLNAELQKGYDSILAGKVHSINEADEIMKTEYGI